MDRIEARVRRSGDHRVFRVLLAFAIGGFSASASAAQQGCSPATLKGRYVFAGLGFIEPLEPGIQRAHYGTLLFDGSGRLSGKQSSSRGGKIGRELLEGAYTIAADCSGKMAFSFAGRPDIVCAWDF